MRLHELEQKLAASPLVPVDDPLLDRNGIELWLKRDDLLHPIISGNKWRKLKYILEHAIGLGCRRIISMGGAYSNHLHALAYVGKSLGLATAAYIRGEPPPIQSPTLRDIGDWGMQLTFVSRSDYRLLRAYRTYDSLPGMLPGDYWLPEGGAARLALQGIAEIVAEIDRPYDVLVVPCGTGTTLAGLVGAVADDAAVLGVSALKGGDFLYREVRRWLPAASAKNWHIALGYHFGGFAKAGKELTAFIERFEQRQGIALDPVYTGKMLYALYDMIGRGGFPEGRRIVAIHTGGLQGRRTA